MAKLLRSGYKMLNIACPECNNPVFEDKKKGIKFCPICNREVQIVDSNEKSREINLEKLNGNSSELNKSTTNIINDLKGEIYKKITLFTERLRKEDQLGQIDNILDVIEKLLNLFYKLKKES